MRLYWGLDEGSERFTPPNPLATPSQPPRNPLATLSQQQTSESKIIQLDCLLDEFVIICFPYYSVILVVK